MYTKTVRLDSKSAKSMTYNPVAGYQGRHDIRPKWPDIEALPR